MPRRKRVCSPSARTSPRRSSSASRISGCARSRDGTGTLRPETTPNTAESGIATLTVAPFWSRPAASSGPSPSSRIATICDPETQTTRPIARSPCPMPPPVREERAAGPGRGTPGMIARLPQERLNAASGGRGGRRLRSRPRRHLRAREGGGEQEALGGVAGELAQEPGLLLLLNPLGDRQEAEIVGELDRRAHQDEVAPTPRHAGDEGAVDLDLADGELL